MVRCSVHLCLPYKCIISHQTICALQRPAFVLLFHGTTYFRFFHSNLHKIPSNDVSAIKYYSFDMFLSMCRGLGTTKGQSLMNLDRDTHLYSSFWACTNVSFLMNSDRDTHLYSSFCACTNVSFLMNLDRDTHLYSSFCTCTNVSFLMNSDRDTHLYSSFCACTNVSFLMNSDRDTHLYSSFCTCTNVSFRSTVQAIRNITNFSCKKIHTNSYEFRTLIRARNSRKIRPRIRARIHG